MPLCLRGALLSVLSVALIGVCRADVHTITGKERQVVAIGDRQVPFGGGVAVKLREGQH